MKPAGADEIVQAPIALIRKFTQVVVGHLIGSAALQIVQVRPVVLGERHGPGFCVDAETLGAVQRTAAQKEFSLSQLRLKEVGAEKYVVPFSTKTARGVMNP